VWQVLAAEWWRAVEVNLGGAFVLTQLALTHMIPAGRGRIINITSYAGVYRWPLLSAYAASKAALVKLTETLAEETRPHGVSVFSVDPGLLPIGLGEAALSGSADPQTPEGRVYHWIRDQLAAGRGADPEQAARLIVALASGRRTAFPDAISASPTTSAPCSPRSARSSATTCTPCGCAPGPDPTAMGRGLEPGHWSSHSFLRQLRPAHARSRMDTRGELNLLGEENTRLRQLV
jgi:short-subunit dehydrogenase